MQTRSSTRHDALVSSVDSLNVVFTEVVPKWFLFQTFERVGIYWEAEKFRDCQSATGPSTFDSFAYGLGCSFRVSLHFTGFYWVSSRFPGLYWVLLSFTEFYRVLQSLTGLTGLTGFYWVLRGFTGFYWVLPFFIGFY